MHRNLQGQDEPQSRIQGVRVHRCWDRVTLPGFLCSRDWTVGHHSTPFKPSNAGNILKCCKSIFAYFRNIPPPSHIISSNSGRPSLAEILRSAPEPDCFSVHQLSTAFNLTRARPGAVIPSPSGSSQIAKKRRRVAPPNLPWLISQQFGIFPKNDDPMTPKVTPPGHIDPVYMSQKHRFFIELFTIKRKLRIPRS